MLAIAAAGIFAAGTIGGWANTIYGANDAESGSPVATPARFASGDDRAESDPAG